MDAAVCIDNFLVQRDLLRFARVTVLLKKPSGKVGRWEGGKSLASSDRPHFKHTVTPPFY